MKLKDMAVLVAFALSINFLINYFMGPKQPVDQQQQVSSGQSFQAPVFDEVNKPLATDVNFTPAKDEEMLQRVKTKKGVYTFSNHGAVLTQFTLPWQGAVKEISTCASEKSMFLVAGNTKTPQVYTLQSHTADGGKHMLSYAASFGHTKVIKTFTMYDDSYQVDVQLDVQGVSTSHPLQLRMFIVEPDMKPVLSYDKTEGFVNKGKSVDTIALDKEASFTQFWTSPTLLGFSSKYVVHAVVKQDPSFAQRAYLAKRDYLAVGILETPELKKDGSWTVSCYIGPKVVSDMIAVDERLSSTMQYGWLSLLSQPLLKVLNIIHDYTHNYGWAIILLTLLIKILLLPLTMRGEKGMRQAADFQKKLSYLQQKYKDNPDALNQARAALIGKHGMPGMSGCLPMFLNIPVFIALNKVLSTAIELYGASFLWIPDLSAKDPYYILGILVGLVMLANPVGNDVRQKFSRYGMALVFGTITMYFASGLTLFILVNTAVGIVQTKLQKRFL